MADTYLEQIWIDKVDEIDTAALTMACDAGIFGHKPEHILAGVSENTTQLWRGEYNGQRFVIVTQMFDHPGGREFKIWSVGGHGYSAALDNSYKVLKEFADKYNCKWITGLVDREGFKKLYKRFNYNHLYSTWVVELGNVPSETKH